MDSPLRLLLASFLLLSMPILGVGDTQAQSLDDVGLQIHGFATQSFLYSTRSNWNTIDATSGSAAWTEAVVNVSAHPESKTRIGVQARYYILGDYGNEITIDWAQADYRVNEHLGLRVGKVKTPSSLLNESQDIDPAQLWVLLPQSIYSIENRGDFLSHYGGVASGSVSLGESFGKLKYWGFGGERVVSHNDSYFARYNASGLSVPDGVHFATYGGTFHWDTPLPGLLVGASLLSGNPSGRLTLGPIQGALGTSPIHEPYLFTRYERNRLMLAGEYNRGYVQVFLKLPGIPLPSARVDERSFYAMASYKLAQKLTGGLYYSSTTDRQAPFTSDRYHRDWVLATRYDFNQYLYGKLEEHIIDGTLRGFSLTDNSAGINTNPRMTFLKLGVSF